MKEKNNLQIKIICFIFCLIILGALELSARIITCFGTSKLEQILNILDQDPVLFWRQKGGLDVVFQGARVKTNSAGYRNEEIRKKNKIRIVCLGASPTFGWGVKQDKAYPRVLEQLLKENSEANIEVINAGMIGYTSYQGVLLLKNEILKLRPDIITVSYVINDVDKYRFFRNSAESDKELSPKSPMEVRIENILGESAIFKLMRRVIFFSGNRIVKYFGWNPQAEYLERIRVSSADYADNLKEIVKLSRENKIKVIFLKMPVNFPSPGKVSEDLQNKAEVHINQSRELFKHKEVKGAISEAEKAIQYNPFSSKAHYYLGVYLSAFAERKRSEQCFKKTKQLELMQCGKFGKIHNSIMARTAEENGVLLVDAKRAFKDYSQKHEVYLFIDPKADTFHPNEIGHRIIAEEILKILKINKLGAF